ncbi:fumarylacetoacetate hydrolase family protein [Actinomadura roseirufa]|uniref:fumarylacetoacetate hydrolase family protein n=1 Tax=Actinomadura roseirufa TaxID=2094049 RepID=UPI0013F162CD|nr:fumarylacetoacetate hydrolase family protein [Actinomadura roseirufa]
MRLATIEHRTGTSAALVTDDGVAPVRALPGRDDAADVTALISSPLTSAEVTALAGHRLPAREVTWLPPVLHPPKNVICVGKNYREHVEEGARAEGLAEAVIPEAPVYFTKPHTALTGHGATVVADPAFTRALDYEGELALVIGTRARGLTAAGALDCVFGYTIFNDLTARDVQQRHLQWFRGKGADGYGPIGPWIVTADEIPDPRALRVRTLVNGEVRQDDTVKNLIFDLTTLLTDLTQGLTLEPGDIIATGTPQGVAWGMDDPAWLRPGDGVTVEIDGIGRLDTTIGLP